MAMAAIGCSKADDASSGSVSQSDAKASMAGDSASNNPMAKPTMAASGGTGGARAQTASIPAPSPRQVIRTAELEVRVDDVAKAERKVNQLIDGVHGYVENASSTDLATSGARLTIKCRVPVDTFPSIIDAFEHLGVRLSKTVGSEDVTEKVVDMDARLKTMAAQEEVYRGLLRNTKSLKDSLDVHERLMQLREEIESIAAQRKSLASQAAFSTISVTLDQKADAAIAATADPNWVSQSWGEAWTSATTFFRGIVSMLIWLLAYSPVWIALLLALRFGIKAIKGKTVTPPPPVV